MWKIYKKIYYCMVVAQLTGFEVYAEANVFFKTLETIQIVNKEKNHTGPLRVILIFIKNPLFLQASQEWTNEDWLRLLRDFDFFRTNIVHHLAMGPVLINMVDRSVSRTLLVHHNKKEIVAIGVIAISPDGTYISKLIVSNDIDKKNNLKNIIFTIENSRIKMDRGMVVNA